MLNGVSLVDGQMEVGFCVPRGPRWNYLAEAQLGWRMYSPTNKVSSQICGLIWSQYSLVFDEVIGQYQAFEFQDAMLSASFKI